MAQQPLSILIIGAGVAGPTLASFLLTHKDIPPAQTPDITVLERSSSLRAAGQNVDIRGAGVTVARKLGLEGAIRASVTGEEGVRFVDERNRICAEGPADRSGKVQTGTADIEILRGTLARLCYERSLSISDEVQKRGGSGVQYIFDDAVKEIGQDGKRVHVIFNKSGEKRTFDIVVGADGLQSSTRRMVWATSGASHADAEEDRFVHRLGMYGAFWSMPASSSDSKWRRWFHAPGRRSIMVRPGEREDMSTVFMTHIPDPDNEPAFRAAALDGRKGMKEQKDLLDATFKGAGWETERVLREMHESEDFYYDMIAQVKMPSWHKGRVVLLGDAAYCASPISGMGTTLALTGAYNLAGALTPLIQAPRGDKSPLVEECFEQYETAMRPTVQRAQKLVPGAPYIFAPETAWGIWTLHMFGYLVSWLAPVVGLVAQLLPTGPQHANNVPVREYGFRELAEWEGRAGGKA